MKQTLFDKISFETVRKQLMKNSYGKRNTIIAKLDVRLLILRQLFFAIVPWFVHNVWVLAFMGAYVLIIAFLSRIVGLVMLLFMIGVFSKFAYLLIMVIFWGGDVESLLSVLQVSLKFAIVSLSAVSVYSTMNPDRLAKGLEWFGIPSDYVLSVTLGYRMLPVILEEYRNILFVYRSRISMPEIRGFFSMCFRIILQVKLLVMAFYPLILNMAKRARTMSEVLYMKGYEHAIQNPDVKRMHLQELKLTRLDFVFLLLAFAWCIGGATVVSVIGK